MIIRNIRCSVWIFGQEITVLNQINDYQTHKVFGVDFCDKGNNKNYQKHKPLIMN